MVKTQPKNNISRVSDIGIVSPCPKSVLLCFNNPTGTRTFAMEFDIMNETLEYPRDAALYDDGRSTSIYLQFSSAQVARRVKQAGATATPPIIFAYCNRRNCPKCNNQRRVDVEAYLICKRRSSSSPSQSQSRQ